MANDPERPIEKLLRAAAKKRRDAAGAPFELHPATRRMLQGAAARQFAEPRRQARWFPSFLAQLWPRLAWSVAILALLGVTVWTLVQMQANHKQTALLAKLEETQMAARVKSLSSPAREAPAAVTPPPVAAAPPSPAVVPAAETTPIERRKLPTPSPAESKLLAKDKLAPATESNRRENFPLAATPEPSDRPTIAHVQTARSPDAAAASPLGFANDAAVARYGLATRPGAPARGPAAAVLPSSSATRALKEARTAGTVQRFVQLAPERGTKPVVAYRTKAAQPVLAAFDVEQDGRRLRITDRDGSVYTGYVQTPDTAGRVRLFRAEAPAATPAGGAPHATLEEKAQLGYEADQLALHNYAFRVAGTNRSLKQKVVFNGSFIGATNLILLPPATTNLTLGGRLGGTRAEYALPTVPPLLNSRITGKVVIGSGKAFEINALPTAP